MEGRGPFGSRSTRGPHFDPWCSHSIRPPPPVPGKPLESSWRPLRCSLLPLGALMAPDCCGPVDISAKVLAVPWQALALQQSPSPSPQSMSDAGVAARDKLLECVSET